ncbi:MAG: RagB/SusD family nutrient uptake outer membrane protein [Bacteroides sp.]|nr:RagB/SusD family nutrient uptake outer membrane protein [Bacteroides sp.]
MKKIRYTFAILCVTLAVSSCFNDMNKVEFSSSGTLPEEAWLQPETYELFLSKLYAGFALSGNQAPDGLADIDNSDQGEATFSRSYFTLQEYCTDEIRVAWKNNTLDDLQFCRWSSDNYWLTLVYDRMFLTIAYCNEYLRETTPEKLESRGIDNDTRSKVAVYREEARLLRAMNYYFLMDLFGNVPLILEEDGVGAYLPEQKTRQELFTWLEAELKDIEGHLPAISMANYGRVNDAVCWMVLAKLYINAEVYTGSARYTDCITYLKKIIGDGYHKLEPEYKYLFGADNHLCEELIYSIVYDGRYATNWGGTTFLMGLQFMDDMASYENFGITQAWSGGRAPENFSSLFDNDDKRALFWTEDRPQEITDLYVAKQGYSVIKYTNKDRNGNNGSDNQFADTDFPMYRLADVYLMLAEAVERGGTGSSKEEALTYINLLQTRAGLDPISTSQLTLDFLLEERARELYWEGHRRTDLIRFDCLTANYNWPWKGGVQTGIRNLDDKYKLYPIPSSELSVNTNLEQNDGY